MPLVAPSKRDQKGMVGGPSRTPFLRVRRIKPKPMVPKVIKKGVENFAKDIWKGSDRRKR